jgi:hypothetical protein
MRADLPGRAGERAEGERVDERRLREIDHEFAWLSSDGFRRISFKSSRVAMSHSPLSSITTWPLFDLRLAKNGCGKSDISTDGRASTARPLHR